MSNPVVFPLMLIRSAGLPFEKLEALSGDFRAVRALLADAEKDCAESASRVQAAFDSALVSLPDSPQRTRLYNARKVFFQREKLPAVALEQEWAKSPDLGDVASALAAFRKKRESLQAAQSAWLAEYHAVLTRSFAALQAIGREPDFTRALLFSSHDLLERLPAWEAKSAEAFVKKDRQIGLSVLQYATRMATKTSPLSRFTTVSIQKPVPGMPEDAPPSFGKNIVSPNVAVLEAVYAALFLEPAFYRAQSLRLNPSITAVSETGYRWLFFNGEQESIQEAPADPLTSFLVDLMLRNSRKMPFSEVLTHLDMAVAGGREALERYVLHAVDLGLLEWMLPEPGLSPGWSGRLYQHLGALEPTPLIVETASLLQWLRTAARTLPFQGTSEALETQRTALEQVQRYFEALHLEAPSIPAEQLFYEDSEAQQTYALPENLAETLAGSLARCWVAQPHGILPADRAAVRHYLEKTLRLGESIDFLLLSQNFLTNKEPDYLQKTVSLERSIRIGALVQPFQEDGVWKAVVNGLFPGGGKLMARWLHLFPPDVQHALLEWFNVPSGNPDLPFPWQGFANANVQPMLARDALLVPGGRLYPGAGGHSILLGDLEVFREGDVFRLRDRSSGRILRLTDLGLEAPETRPPAIRLLWQLGVPYVSLSALLTDAAWLPLTGEGVAHRARVVWENLVLARASWSLEEAVWRNWAAEEISDHWYFRDLRDRLEDLGVPRHFFARFSADNPQYFDRESPVLLLLFRAMLRKGNGVLVLTEMLPLPEQMLAAQQGQRAMEMVIEFWV